MEQGSAEGQDRQAKAARLAAWAKREGKTFVVTARGAKRAWETIAGLDVRVRGKPTSPPNRVHEDEAPEHPAPRLGHGEMAADDRDKEGRPPDTPASDPESGPGGLRGEIGGYTSASRKRLRQTVLAVESALLPRRRGKRFYRPATFATLTYPRVWDPDPKTWKRDLETFGKALGRRYPGAWFIWALEIQKRGAPHFHLILHWNDQRQFESYKVRQAWISETWARIVGKGTPDPEHLKAGTNLRPLVTPKLLRVYVEKPGTKLHPAHMAGRELAKRGPQKGGSGFGRWWGIWNRPGYQACAVVVVVDVSLDVAAQLAVGIEADWQEYFEALNRLRVVQGKPPFEIGEYLPRHVAGRAVDAVLDATGTREAVFGADWIDVNTGESVQKVQDPAEGEERRRAG